VAKGKRHIYAIALGSNQPRSRKLTPRRLVAKAMERLSKKPFNALMVSRIIETPPLGPSLRRYANAAVLVETKLAPPELLRKLNKMERKAGRHHHARKWSARPLDLDILLWSGGIWADDDLIIPHPEFRKRDFVLRPLAQVAPAWRDPLTGLTPRHLLARLHKSRKKA
jgi:2-amino-4-hydroxy-6-hydroxymethyldihydropteridine diphosphokinase